MRVLDGLKTQPLLARTGFTYAAAEVFLKRHRVGRFTYDIPDLPFQYREYLYEGLSLEQFCRI